MHSPSIKVLWNRLSLCRLLLCILKTVKQACCYVLFVHMLMIQCSMLRLELLSCGKRVLAVSNFNHVRLQTACTDASTKLAAARCLPGRMCSMLRLS